MEVINTKKRELEEKKTLIRLLENYNIININ